MTLAAGVRWSHSQPSDSLTCSLARSLSKCLFVNYSQTYFIWQFNDRFSLAFHLLEATIEPTFFAFRDPTKLEYSIFSAPPFADAIRWRKSDCDAKMEWIEWRLTSNAWRARLNSILRFNSIKMARTYFTGCKYRYCVRRMVDGWVEFAMRNLNGCIFNLLSKLKWRNIERKKQSIRLTKTRKTSAQHRMAMTGNWWAMSVKIHAHISSIQREERNEPKK